VQSSSDAMLLRLVFSVYTAQNISVVPIFQAFITL
jgi:hypothetical protein